jgi:hypothetical protein
MTVDRMHECIYTNIECCEATSSLPDENKVTRLILITPGGLAEITMNR